jgi:hypothetical protein
MVTWQPYFTTIRNTIMQAVVEWQLSETRGQLRAIRSQAHRQATM